jgi:hypothetical protein
MDFSVGLLYSAQDLIRYINKNTLAASDFLKQFPNYNLIRTSSSEKVLEICQIINWIQINSCGYMVLTDSARPIIDSASYKECLREQLKSIILILRPSWSKLIPHGRKQTLDFLPEEIFQCFDEAGLVEGRAEEIVDWWDKLAMAVRGIQNDINLTTGRYGERLSYEYEKKRTGNEPNWMAIESNHEGFDIISILSQDDSARLLIEVKSTLGNFNDSDFYLSRKEAYAAQISKNYIFHLWELNKKSKFVIVSSSEVLQHVPKDINLGKWESVKIPFNAFEKKFIEFGE